MNVNSKRHITTMVCLAVLLPACAFDSAGRQGPAILQEHQLTTPQRERLHELRMAYYQNRFHHCMKLAKRVNSCGDCTAVSFRAIITIGRDGRLVRYAKIIERFCGQAALPPAFEECLAEYLRGLVFPAELRGLTIECDLGRALKC